MTVTFFPCGFGDSPPRKKEAARKPRYVKDYPLLGLAALTSDTARLPIRSSSSASDDGAVLFHGHRIVTLANITSALNPNPQYSVKQRELDALRKELKNLNKKLRADAESNESVSSIIEKQKAKISELEAWLKDNKPPAEAIKQAKKRRNHLAQHLRSLDYTQILVERLFPNRILSAISPLVDDRYRENAFQEVMGFYMLPGTTLPRERHEEIYSSEAPPRIKHVVMNNCLFGGYLQGQTKQGDLLPLIDHDLQVASHEVTGESSAASEPESLSSVSFDQLRKRVDNIITSVKVETRLHPYELMVFAAFKGLVPVIRALGAPAHLPKIRYHLPVMDYMLYGVHLFIQGKMDFHALSTYVESVKARGMLHKKILTELGADTGLSIKTESPFDNLLDPNIEITADAILKNLSQFSPEQLADLERQLPNLYAYMIGTVAILKEDRSLGLCDFLQTLHSLIQFTKSGFRGLEFLSSEFQEEFERAPDLLEKMFVSNLLDRLQNNAYVPEHQAGWRQIIGSGAVSYSSPLKRLFEVANTAEIIFARRLPGVDDNEVCALLPFDEKPVVENYKQRTRVAPSNESTAPAPSFSDQYGHVVSLLWLPPLLSEVNSPRDASRAGKNCNNLFRLSPADAPPYEETRGILTSCFGLDHNFWNVVDRFVLPNGEPCMNRRDLIQFSWSPRMLSKRSSVYRFVRSLSDTNVILPSADLIDFRF